MSKKKTLAPSSDAVPRADWEALIEKALAEHGDDVDAEWLDAPLTSEADETEWTW